MKVATPTLFFLLFRIGKRMAASASKLLENALLSIQGRERNSSKVGSIKGMGPVLATKGLFAREGCPVKIRTGGMPRIA